MSMKRIQLSLEQKYGIICAIERGISVVNLAKEYKVDTSTLYKMLKKKKELKAAFQSGDMQAHSKRCRVSTYPVIDHALINWFKETQTNCQQRISLSDLKSKTREFAAKMNLKVELSMSWIGRWKRRHNIISRPKSGELISANMKCIQSPLTVDALSKVSLGEDYQTVHLKRECSDVPHILEEGISTKNELMVVNSIDNENTTFSNGRKRHVCVICEKVFSQKNNLTTHIDVLHKGLKKYICGRCNKAYGYASDLTRHLKRVHEGFKQHVCGQCGRASACASDLSKHVKRVHEGFKKPVCEQCGRVFFSACNLTKHIKLVHEEHNVEFSDESRANQTGPDIFKNRPSPETLRPIKIESPFV